jgi:hypothetical protein
MTTKEMLAEVIRRAVLKPREKEDLVDLWDRIHRYGRVSDRQKAWVEKVFFEHKLDRTPAPTGVRRRVVVPTWQKERRPRHVEASSVERELLPDGGRTEQTVRLVPPVGAQSGVIQPSRIVAVKSTDIQRLQRRTNGLAPTNPRPSSKSGTFSALVPGKAYQIGYINYEGAPRELLITNMESLRDHCPRIRPGSQQYQKIEAFFRTGGKVLKVKPGEASRVA